MKILKKYIQLDPPYNTSSINPELERTPKKPGQEKLELHPESVLKIPQTSKTACTLLFSTEYVDISPSSPFNPELQLPK